MEGFGCMVPDAGRPAQADVHQVDDQWGRTALFHACDCNPEAVERAAREMAAHKFTPTPQPSNPTP